MTGPIILGEALRGIVLPCFEQVRAAQEPQQTFLAAYIGFRMREIGYAVKDVAEAMGMTRQFLHGVLRGDTKVPDSLLLKLAQATEITYPELVVAHAVDMLLAADMVGESA